MPSYYRELPTVNCWSWQFTIARRQKNLPLAPPMLGTNWNLRW